jgi:hypothetical protein
MEIQFEAGNIPPSATQEDDGLKSLLRHMLQDRTFNISFQRRRSFTEEESELCWHLIQLQFLKEKPQHLQEGPSHIIVYNLHATDALIRFLTDPHAPPVKQYAASQIHRLQQLKLQQEQEEIKEKAFIPYDEHMSDFRGDLLQLELDVACSASSSPALQQLSESIQSAQSMFHSQPKKSIFRSFFRRQREPTTPSTPTYNSRDITAFKQHLFPVKQKNELML